MKLKLRDFPKQLHGPFYDYIKKTYGEKEFDVIETMKERRFYSNGIVTTIINIPKCQNKEMFDYFKSVPTDSFNVMMLIEGVKKIQNKAWFDYFKSFNPRSSEVCRLIRGIEKYQTKEIFNYYLSLKPEFFEKQMLEKRCEKFKMHIQSMNQSDNKN